MKTTIYCRISSVGQVDGVSLDAQLDECKKACAANKLSLPTTVQEVCSAYESIPPLMKVMLNKRNHRFMFYAADRFSRNVALGLEMAKKIIKNGSIIVCLREKLVVDKMEGPAWLKFVQALTQAEGESKAISARVKGAIKYLKSNGYHCSGHVPYGYRVVPDEVNERRKRLVENPEEQKVLAYIQMATCSGTNVASINRALKAINSGAADVVVEHEDERRPLKKLKHALEYLDVAYFLEGISTYRGKPWTPARISAVLASARKRAAVATADLDQLTEEFMFMSAQEEEPTDDETETDDDGMDHKYGDAEEVVDELEDPDDSSMDLDPEEIKIDEHGWQQMPPPKAGKPKSSSSFHTPPRKPAPSKCPGAPKKSQKRPRK